MMKQYKRYLFPFILSFIWIGIPAVSAAQYVLAQTFVYNPVNRAPGIGDIIDRAAKDRLAYYDILDFRRCRIGTNLGKKILERVISSKYEYRSTISQVSKVYLWMNFDVLNATTPAQRTFLNEVQRARNTWVSPHMQEPYQSNKGYLQVQFIN